MGDEILAKAKDALSRGSLEDAEAALREAIWRRSPHDPEVMPLVMALHASRGEKESESIAFHAIRGKRPPGDGYGAAPAAERFAEWLRSWIKPKWRPESMTIDELARWVVWLEEMENPALADWLAAATKRRDELIDYLPLTRLQRALEKNSIASVEAIARELLAFPLDGADLSRAAVEIQTVSPKAAIPIYERVLTRADLPAHWRGITADNLLIACALDDLHDADRLIGIARPFADGYPSIHYNIACIEARRGNRDAALASIALALKHGFADPAKMHADGDFSAYRGSADFESLFVKR